MILLRFDELQGRYCDIHGGQEQYDYGEDRAGWFPIESMNFGFKSTQEAQVGGAGNQNGNANVNPAAGGGGHQPSAGPAGGGGNGSDDEAFSTISIAKYVDGATIELMGFAMKDRNAKKSERSKMRKADIHFLHSVMGKDTGSNPRYIFPYLMITLEHVLIKGWNISASGDERPTENLELWYDKAAMRYYRTKDGQVWIGGQSKGWDQYKNEEWIISDDEKKYFSPPKNR